MHNDEIIHLADHRIPTIVSYNNDLRAYVIGDAARPIGLRKRLGVSH